MRAGSRFDRPRVRGEQRPQRPVLWRVRHRPRRSFAWTDAIWAKYGEPFTEYLTKIKDPKTTKAPNVNMYRVAGYGMQLPNLGNTIDDLVKRASERRIFNHRNAVLLGKRTNSQRE